ncbi:MAG: hypothetical protein J7K40_00680 [candidate division Zixibacteria bacterium]|nr:hypothetical protein [candidate division Zixibacteria bacterium]
MMVGIVIISISAVALYYMYVQGHVLLEEHEHRRKAFVLARELIADKEIEAATNKAIDIGEFIGEVELEPPNPDDDDEISGLTGTYKMGVELKDYGYLIKLTISWQERTGRDYKIFLPKTIPNY